VARPTHFEIHAADPEAAVAFYTAVFDWQAQKWDGPVDYWLLTTGDDADPGINGAIVRRQGERPQSGQAVNAFVCTVSVDDLDSTLEAATGAGAATALPRMAVPGVGWLAYVNDPEGNILGILEPDQSAP
jgi:predicted enzyme related to lactoylglutathione lyase